MSRMERGRPIQQVDGYYDDFYVCPPGTYPSIVVQREPTEGWYERAVEALTFPDTRFEMLARRVDQLFRW